MKKKPVGYIVVWNDDDNGISAHMGWDPECNGAIEYSGEAVAMFPTRADARKSIRISAANARLLREQGKVANDDFLGDGLKKLKVMPLFAVGVS
jgi:hypothetical protein